MFVKICGITRLEDAEAAVACGAGALGFVFWPDSPRFIDPYRARAITSMVPAFVTTVGVFVNQPESHVNGVAALAGIGAVQLHGDEGPAFAASIVRPVIKALGRVDPGAVDIWPAHVTLLVDAHDPIRRGGTGERADWISAAALARRRRVLLAGGLNAQNVAAAVAEVRPFGVDVSSGVESRPGIKDRLKMKALFEALHSS
jgi:phosphoribosylanthranilate isomerase